MIKSILNPYWNSFLKKEYSGSENEIDLSNLSETLIPSTTITTGINEFGQLLISSILTQLV